MDTRIEKIFAKSESDYKRTILKELNNSGYFFPISPSQFMAHGVSDILGINKKGRFVAIELKVSSVKSVGQQNMVKFTPAQIEFLEKIHNNLGLAWGLVIFRYLKKYVALKPEHIKRSNTIIECFNNAPCFVDFDNLKLLVNRITGE